jgi:FkbM family methyltransferase
MPLSYAQNMEDYHLALAFEGQERGTYIDVGAGHPVADNVSLWFYERGWSGLVVEPQADLAALYPLVRRRDRVYEGLVGRTHGLADFYEVDRLHGFSTTVQAHAENALTFGADYRVARRSITTLARLCEEHGLSQIDFLKVDVEGGEADVLAGNDWNRFRPKVIVAEAVTPGKGEPCWEAFEPMLLSNGYRFRLFDTLNRFYVADEHRELFEKLPSERAPWESVTHMYEIGRAPESANHPDHLLTRRLARGLWATLPHIDPALMAELLRRGGGEAADDPSSEEFRLALGRIACGYDGGQIVEEKS